MVEAKFTPGPWLYRPHEFDDWGIVKAERGVICQARDPVTAYDELELSKHRAAGTDPWHGNANLIAAAPSLYDALDGFITYHSGHVNTCPELAARIKAGRHALAKARGEE